MPATDLELLTHAAIRSGEVAKTYFGNSPKTWQKADDAGPVTAADLAVNVMLHETLSAERKDYGWLSEETEDGGDRLQSEAVFVIDPIDGTRAFIEGSNDWAHSLAVVRNGAVTAAAVYVPMRNLMFTASIGGGAHLNGVAIRPTSLRNLADSTILTHKVNCHQKFWRSGRFPDAKIAFRSSLAYRLCLVAQGRFDAMITLRPTWEWDVAAGSLIVSEAGGIATDQRGNALQYNNPHPQVDGMVAAGGLHESLIAQLA